MLSMFNADGSPYGGDPRHVLKKVLTRVISKLGWRPVVAAELEFSLVRCRRRLSPSTPAPLPRGGSPVGGNTYDLDCTQSTPDAMLEDLRLACEVQDIPFDGVVKESAPSQYEINMQHVDNPVLAAKQILMMKRLN